MAQRSQYRRTRCGPKEIRLTPRFSAVLALVIPREAQRSRGYNTAPKAFGAGQAFHPATLPHYQRTGIPRLRSG
jgi:hypothetical protein